MERTTFNSRGRKHVQSDNRSAQDFAVEGAAEKEFDEVLKEAQRCPDEISRRDILILLAGSEDDERSARLFRTADEVRRRYVGDEIHLRGIIEFSNHCIRNCLYCGLRASNKSLRRYRMSPDQIVGISEAAASLGYVGTIVLQSGEDLAYDAKSLSEIIREIKRRTGLAVTLSVGDRSESELDSWRKAGADRYLLKHETADAELFRRLRPGTTLAGRLECLRSLRDLGYQIGSGNMVGLPGQTLSTLADDLVLLREMDVEMAGIGPFIPNPETPLKSAPPGSVDLTLRVLATARLVLPWAHLPATTALATADPQGRQEALLSGANVVMPNVGPTEYRDLYSIYPGKAGLSYDASSSIESVVALAASLGRPIGKGPGHSSKPLFRGPGPCRS